jgi:ferredoxin
MPGEVVVMRIVIDTTKCMSNGLCESIAPEMIEVGEDAIAHVVAQPRTDADVAAAREAARMCPMTAIELEEES